MLGFFSKILDKILELEYRIVGRRERKEMVL